MYQAVGAVLPYFKTAYDLDQKPNEKGKIKPKYSKDIKGILGTNHVDMFNGAAYYFEQKDYKKAYDLFNQYIEVAELPMFEGTPTATKDSTYMMVQYYAAISATQLGDPKITIAALERAKNSEYKQNDIYQYLCYEYEQAQDTVSLEKILEEGMVKFPEEPYYIMKLINTYIYSNRNKEALEYLHIAIQKDPNNVNLYNVLGHVYERGFKDYAKAEENYKKAFEIDANSVEALSNLGRIYFNQGVDKQSEANMINDSKKYQEELNKAKDFFKQALPFYEKAHQAKPDEKEYMIALRGIYYNLNMGPELEAIEAQMNE